MDTQEKSIFILVVIAASVLGIVLLYFIVTIIRQQRKSKQLHLDKMQAEIRTLERERKRFASDLHDDLGPLLSAIRFKINSIDPSSPEDEQLIADVSQHIDDSLTRIREIAFNLMPGTLLRKGLVATVEEIISKTENHFPFIIKFSANENQLVDQEKSVHLYRIILEILHNTIKHAHATELTLSVYINETTVRFQSQDNGVGFDPEVVKNNAHGLGLKNLQSRVEIMGGEICIESEPGKGVHCSFEIPL
ncbi:sensor histidine kinase [Lacibacter luteus]|uniref:Oxygen sensor histidine kinase NreB n=1 Tax=Lacibacter luteus TaxID=2508719 RepID=A0A4Q1CF77_9BACT|nr:sensor histidine kinase [Lacibacter luteus]RXK58558.1 sensor histidine kinase [Lacibacter luteus]